MAQSFMGVLLGQQIERSMQPCNEQGLQSKDPCFRLDKKLNVATVQGSPDLGFPYRFDIFLDEKGAAEYVSIESDAGNMRFLSSLLTRRFGKSTPGDAVVFSRNDGGNVVHQPNETWVNGSVAMTLQRNQSPRGDELELWAMSRDEHEHEVRELEANLTKLSGKF